MKYQRLIWIIFVPLFLIFLGLFYIEVSVYSLLPPEHGGMSFRTELKNVWYRSVWFYAMVLLASYLLYLRFTHKRK
jgi:hypothetical protein